MRIALTEPLVHRSLEETPTAEAGCRHGVLLMIQRLTSSIALTLSFMFLCCSELDKPNRVESGVSTWFTTFGGPASEIPKIVTPLPDGGWAIMVIPNRSWETTAHVVRLDESGTVSLVIELPEGYHAIDHIAVTEEGDYLTADDVRSSGDGYCYDVKVTKISSTGELLWESVIDHFCREKPGPLLPAPNGECIVSGVYTIRDSLGSHAGEGMYLTVLDDAGQTALDTTYLEAWYLSLVDIVPIGGDRFVLAGNYRKERQGGTDIVLLTFDYSGALLWMKTYGAEGHDAVHHLTVNEDGLLVSGRASSYDLLFFKTDFDGNLLWQRIAPHWPSTSTRSYRIETSVVTRDECLIAAGSVSIRQGWNNVDFYFCKWDRTGRFAWEREKGGWKWDELRHVLETPDGGYLFVGVTESVGEGRADIFVLKTDRDGKYSAFAPSN